MTKVSVRSLGGEIELPARLMRDPLTLKFVDTLHERGGIERPVAERYAASILAHTSGEFAARLGRELETQFGRLGELRIRLKGMYDRVIEHWAPRGGRMPGPLPADLQPQAFRRVFIEMATEFKRLEELRPQAFAAGHPPGEGLDVRAGVPRRSGGPRSRAAHYADPRAKDIADRLDVLEARHGENLRHYPGFRGFEVIDQLLDAGRLDEAAAALRQLQHDIDIAGLHGAATSGPGSALARRAEAGEAPDLSIRYGRRPNETIEGPRRLPDLPADAPEVPLDRLTVDSRPPESAVDQARQWTIILREGRSGAGLDFEAFWKQRLAAEPPVWRDGRMPDVGRIEITIEGMFGSFTEHKLQQLWLDLVDLGEIRLLVPGLSPEATTQIRQLAQAAETLLGRPVAVHVIETAP
jgi:hypothetical protein